MMDEITQGGLPYKAMEVLTIPFRDQMPLWYLLGLLGCSVSKGPQL